MEGRLAGRGKTILTAVAAALLAACATPPPPLGTGLPAAWRPSPSFEGRRPNLVVLHHTSDDTAEEALGTLLAPERKVSAHYLVGRDGRIFQLVDERHRAWHAGVSYWGGQTDVNSASIGIELDNNGFEPYPEAQISALLLLLADLKARYNLPAANFVGHGDVAPGRKDDPKGEFFPWKRLAEHGFGLWCDHPYPPAPMGFDLSMGLLALGYDATHPAALSAFRSHFLGGATADDPALVRDTLHCLLRRKVPLPSLAPPEN